MKKQLFYFLTFLISFGLLSCSNDEDDTVEQDPFVATQADLNAAITAADLGVSGTPYGEDVTVAHNGQPVSPDSTIRDIFMSSDNLSDDIDVGTIFTKHTYLKNEDGSKGALAVTFAMIKHEAGYYPDGGDWEYVVMPNDGSNDYDENPNGMLPAESATDMRGELANCASCHSAGGENFLFVK
jgi:hypothetical protein